MDSRLQGAEYMEVDGEQTEDTMMQDGEGEEQRPPFQAEGAPAQETTMQRQKLLSEAGVLEKKEYEQEQYRQKLAGGANATWERSKDWNKKDKSSCPMQVRLKNKSNDSDDKSSYLIQT